MIKSKLVTKLITCLILIPIFIPTTLISKGTSFQWQIGEELTYKVEWSFIRLGTVKLQVYDTLTINDKFVYHLKFYIDSNPLLFFVNMHSVYECFIDDLIRPHLFNAEEYIDNISYKTEYRFNYEDRLISINMTDVNNTANVIVEDIPLDKRIFDGISLIFYARANVPYVKSEILNVLFERQKGNITINFKGNKDKVEVDAFDMPLETYYLDGELHIKGIAGVTGPFKGWFAVDRKRPPLKAELKVFIGHIKVELEEWKNWNHKLAEIQN